MTDVCVYCGAIKPMGGYCVYSPNGEHLEEDDDTVQDPDRTCPYCGDELTDAELNGLVEHHCPKAPVVVRRPWRAFFRRGPERSGPLTWADLHDAQKYFPVPLTVQAEDAYELDGLMQMSQWPAGLAEVMAAEGLLRNMHYGDVAFDVEAGVYLESLPVARYELVAAAIPGDAEYNRVGSAEG